MIRWSGFADDLRISKYITCVADHDAFQEDLANNRNGQKRTTCRCTNRSLSSWYIGSDLPLV